MMKNNNFMTNEVTLNSVIFFFIINKLRLEYYLKLDCKENIIISKLYFVKYAIMNINKPFSLKIYYFSKFSLSFCLIRMFITHNII